MQRIFQNDTGTAFLDIGAFPDMELLAQCVADVRPLLEVKPAITSYGKACHQQRNVGFFSDASEGYAYSNTMMRAQPLTPATARLLAAVCALLPPAQFNGILVNEYTGGSDYISAHSDSELGIDPVGVVSVSCGAERTFRIRDKGGAKHRIVADVPTAHGGVMHMGGDFQALYTHEIPVQRRVREPRISFSFRSHNK